MRVARVGLTRRLSRRVYCLQRSIIGGAKVAELEPALVRSIRALNELDNVVYAVASDIVRTKLACFNITHDDVAKFRASTARWRAARATGRDACNTRGTEKIPRETVGNPNWREAERYLEKFCPLEFHSLQHNLTYTEDDEVERKRRDDAHKKKRRQRDEKAQAHAAAKKKQKSTRAKDGRAHGRLKPR